MHMRGCAFDTVDYNILLEKLHKYGFHDIAYKWLKIDVTNRRQFVCVKGCYSNKARLICGVPQGCILGPLLFLICINDSSRVSQSLFLIMFADDMLNLI